MSAAPAPDPAAAPFARLAPYAMATATVLFWSGNYTLARSVTETFPPIALAFWRWVLAWAILMPFAWPAMRQAWPVIRANWGRLALLGVLGIPGYNTMVYFAFHTTTTINAAVLNSTMPLAIVVMSWALYRERLTRVQALGVAVSLIGVLWIVARGDPATLAAFDITVGDVWVIGAVLVYALYMVLLRLRPAGLGGLAFLGITVSFGILALLPFFLVELVVVGAPHLSVSNAASVLYMAVFASVLAYIFWNQATATLGANRTGVFIHLVPVFTTIMALSFLGETLHWYHVIGMAGVLVGVVLVARGGQRRAVAA
ncbi:MAG: DMT family transporter [Alphaproteobacteria bacterium]